MESGASVTLALPADDTVRVLGVICPSRFRRYYFQGGGTRDSGLGASKNTFPWLALDFAEAVDERYDFIARTVRRFWRHPLY